MAGSLAATMNRGIRRRLRFAIRAMRMEGASLAEAEGILALSDSELQAATGRLVRFAQAEGLSLDWWWCGRWGDLLLYSRAHLRRQTADQAGEA